MTDGEIEKHHDLDEQSTGEEDEQVDVNEAGEHRPNSRGDSEFPGHEEAEEPDMELEHDNVVPGAAVNSQPSAVSFAASVSDYERKSEPASPMSALSQVSTAWTITPPEPKAKGKATDYSECDPGTSNHLKCWHPEDEGFWNNYGKKIAKRNLWVSAVNNGMMFVLWTVPSVLGVMLQSAHDADPSVYHFDGYVKYADYMNPTEEEKEAHGEACAMLAVVGGLAGATMRCVNVFMVPLTGTRMHSTMNPLVALPGMAMLAAGLMNPDVSYDLLVVACFIIAGVGGGAFCSSNTSITFFFPKQKLGGALGINAGIGNLGVGFCQIVFPALAAVPILGMAPISEEAKSPFGGQVWPAQACWIFFGIIFVLMALACKYMVTMPMHGSGTVLGNLKPYVVLMLMGFAGSGLGVGILMVTKQFFTNSALKIIRAFVLAGVCLFSTCCIVYFTGWIITGDDSVKKKMNKQREIFKDKHTHIQTLLYIKTLGSFVGYSMAYPKLIQDTFGYLKDGSINPAMVGASAKFAWLGPFLSAISRTIGGNLADKYGGANISHWSSCIQICACIANGVIMMMAKERKKPEELFIPFMATYIILMCAAGSGNGSVFKQIAALFEAERRAPVLGWTAVVAAYGAAIFPALFAAVKQKVILMSVMTTFYLACGFLNDYYYRGSFEKCTGKGAERPC